MRRRVMIGGMAGALAAVASPRAARAAAGPVVLELFTSQGCSSCPPADRLLGTLSRDPAVVALAWHVDYWNSLGWADPFASRLATDRQRAFAARLGEPVYTPALVVGGVRMVVGSDRAAIDAAIATVQAPPVAVSIARGGGGLTASVAAAGRPVAAIAALYDPQRATDVGRGENTGRRLTEYRIVRAASVLADWDGAGRTLALPDVPAGQGIAVLVQDETLRVLGVADLRPPVA
ncbi:MAG: DUF1223 domain-containing protein [Proteobacteria bacterium]|nr:DUF1223 domain-containing protein [Pseudomonadota bacterium]